MIPNPEVEAVAVVDDLSLALVASLAAFGIFFSAAGGIDDVGPWVVDKFESFVNSIGASFSSVVDSMRYGVDKAGNLIGTPESLEYSARFALALQDEYSLLNNSSVSTAPGGLSVYILSDGTNSFSVCLLPAIWYTSNNSERMVVSNSSPVYYFLHPVNSNSYTIRMVSGSPFSVTSYPINRTVNASVSDSYFFARLSDLGYYVEGSVVSLNFPSDIIYSSDLPTFPSYPWSVSPSGDSEIAVTINSGSIDIPQVGDYIDDDGILIDGFGSWGDTLQDIWDKVSGLTVPDSSWPTVTWGAVLSDQLIDSLVSAGELTTENSPGFFNGLPLISGIPDFSFGDLWHYVTDWVSSMSGGLSLIGGIMFSLPFVAAFYALVVILIVLSLWRLLRSA